MRSPLFRRISISAFSLAILSSGCGSPLWRFDNYVVEGELTGRRCRVMVDGHPLTARNSAHDDTVGILRDNVLNSGLPAGQGVKTLYCLGLLLVMVSPEGTLPAP